MKPADVAIERHGAIGNLRGSALVGEDGSIDWCCLPAFDHPSVFAALLDARRGGRFRVAPRGVARGTQRYRDDSNVLETGFELAGASLRVTDFMPVEASRRGLAAGPAEIHRVLEAHGGAVRVEVEWSPRFEYARGPTGIGPRGLGWVAAGALARCSLVGLPERGVRVLLRADGNHTLRAGFALAAGETRVLSMRWGDGEAAQPPAPPEAAEQVARAWQQWAARGHDPAWAGAHRALVRRSALALKLLCHADSGGIVAAPTTSLPESIGGERNWDYRYVWLRDAGMTVEALLGSGHDAEVGEFFGFIERCNRRPNPHGPWLQLVFGVDGATEMPEVRLPHLRGYAGSRPVRIGNAIARHRGHDVYEQVLGAALEYAALGYELKPAVRRFLVRAADIAAHDWRRPDNGIWEIPGGPRHFVHSKWTVCTALDHAQRLAREHGLKGDVARWAQERAACCAQVLEHGYDRRRRRFRMAYDLDALDSANVLMPVLGFLPADDPRVVSNLRHTMRELFVGDLCYRYRMDDGLRGEEGCFVACTFWAIEALLLAGQTVRARRLFDRAARRAGPLGLWSEQIDPHGGRHLGNYPQAFSHVAFHDAALRLADAEGRRVPVPVDPAGVARRRRPPAGRERRPARAGLGART